MQPHIRVGDAERDDAIQRLQKHASEGRLDLEEFDARVQLALEAQTAGDLQTLFDDLPDNVRFAPTGYGPVKKVARREESPWWASSTVFWLALLAMVLAGGAVGKLLVPLLIGSAIWVWVIAPMVLGARGDATAPDSFEYRDGDVKGELVALVRANRKIEAIKRYREEYGTGLAEAKNAIDSIERAIQRGISR